MNQNSIHQFMCDNQGWTRVNLYSLENNMTSNVDIENGAMGLKEIQNIPFYNICSLNFWFSDKDIALLFRLRYS